MSPNHNILALDKNIDIFEKKTPLEQNTISKNNVIINKKQKNNNRSKNCKVLKNSQISSSRIKTIKNNQNEENQNPDDK